MKNQLKLQDKFFMFQSQKDPIDRFLVKMDSFFGHNIRPHSAEAIQKFSGDKDN